MDQEAIRIMEAAKAAYKARQITRQMARIEAQARELACGERIASETAWTAAQARAEHARDQRRERRAWLDLDRALLWAR